MDKQTKKEMKEFLRQEQLKDIPICTKHKRENCMICFYSLMIETDTIKEKIKR